MKHVRAVPNDADTPGPIDEQCRATLERILTTHRPISNMMFIFEAPDSFGREPVPNNTTVIFGMTKAMKRMESSDEE